MISSQAARARRGEADRGEHSEATGVVAVSELVQFIVVVAFGAFCFGCGYLTASIVTRNKWRAEMIRRGVARYNWQTGKWEWGGWLLPAAPHRTSRVLDSFGGSPTMSTIYSALLVMLRY